MSGCERYHAFLLGLAVGIILMAAAQSCERSKMLAQSARACAEANDATYHSCVNAWWESRGYEAPWPEIRAADRARLTKVVKVKRVEILP